MIKNNNNIDAKDSLVYILERRHNDLMEGMFNSVYSNQINDRLKLTAGIEGRLSKGMHYATIDDMLGAKNYIDVDNYIKRDAETSDKYFLDLTPAERDIVSQNDLRKPNRTAGTDDVVRYKYNLNVATANAFAQAEWNWNRLSVFGAAKLTYTQFYRYGLMDNGRAWYLREKKGENTYSLGKSKTWFFTDPSAKIGFAYNIDNKSRLAVNLLAETRAPQVQSAYVSERIKDTKVMNLTNEKILSGDINYTFNYKVIRGRVSAFYTQINDAIDKLGYYDDELGTFVNHVLTGANKAFQGIEAGITVPVNTWLSISAAGTYGDYRYTNNAMGTKSMENGALDDASELVLTKDLKINNGPQLAANITFDMFYKMWFFDVTLNYYDNNYLDFAPNRFTESNQNLFKTNPNPDVMKKLGMQEKLKGGFMLDASIGKLIYLKNRNSLNFNLSVSNMLNNTDMITGGYQQARIPMYNDTGAKKINTKGLNMFPNKYYYAWGTNFFLNIGYKFAVSNKKADKVVPAIFDELQPKPAVKNEVRYQVAVEEPKQEPKQEIKQEKPTEQQQTKKVIAEEKPKCVFETNKYEVSNASKIVLDTIVGELKKTESLLVIIKGHTDSTGSSEYNQRLSEKRANAVKTYLINKGIASKRISAAGFGATQPIADNNTDEGRNKNRRVEIIIE